jgi:hypothetical protein
MRMRIFFHRKRWACGSKAEQSIEVTGQHYNLFVRSDGRIFSSRDLDGMTEMDHLDWSCWQSKVHEEELENLRARCDLLEEKNTILEAKIKELQIIE